MARFQSKPRYIEAIPVRGQMTITDKDGKTQEGVSGDWLITEDNGDQRIMEHRYLKQHYVPANRNAQQVLDMVDEFVAEREAEAEAEAEGDGLTPPAPLSLDDADDASSGGTRGENNNGDDDDEE